MGDFVLQLWLSEEGTAAVRLLVSHTGKEPFPVPPIS